LPILSDCPVGGTKTPIEGGSKYHAKDISYKIPELGYRGVDKSADVCIIEA